MRRPVLALALALALGSRAAAAPAPRWVEYWPRGFVPDAAWRPSAAGLRADAESLAALGVRAAVVPVTVPAACRFLRRHGVAVVVGLVEHPERPVERRAARRLARCTTATVVDLPSPSAARDALAAVGRLRRATGKPVFVRAPMAALLRDPALAGAGELALAVLDPWPPGSTGTQEACGRAMQALNDLRAAAPAAHPLLVAAWATGGDPAAEHRQRAYLACLESRGTPFVLQEAFDQPWRGAGASSRGAFRADGTPKRWASLEAPLRLAVERRTAGSVGGRLDGAGRARVLVWERGEAGWVPLAPSAVPRGGRWRLSVPGGPARARAATAVAPEWTPGAAALESLPAVDGAGVLAVAPAG